MTLLCIPRNADPTYATKMATFLLASLACCGDAVLVSVERGLTGEGTVAVLGQATIVVTVSVARAWTVMPASCRSRGTDLVS